jgi:pyruvate/2-oxoglutarate dehydrogenase complex dihydrolipoamide acyltransferase (E2) component
MLRWLKAPGDCVAKSDPVVEIETNKVTAEIEAAAPRFLGEISAREGDVVPARDIPSVIRAKLPLAEKGARLPLRDVSAVLTTTAGPATSRTRH